MTTICTGDPIHGKLFQNIRTTFLFPRFWKTAVPVLIFWNGTCTVEAKENSFNFRLNVQFLILKPPLNNPEKIHVIKQLGMLGNLKAKAQSLDISSAHLDGLPRKQTSEDTLLYKLGV